MKKIDRIINNLREMMTANPPGESSGFSSQSPPEGPTAGYDPLMNVRLSKRTKLPDLRSIPPSRRRWAKALYDKTFPTK